MKRMQMWLSTRSSSDPSVEVANECYWVTRMTDNRYLATRQRDSTRVGVFSVTGPTVEVLEEEKPETQQLLKTIAQKARRQRLVR